MPPLAGTRSAGRGWQSLTAQAHRASHPHAVAVEPARPREKLAAIPLGILGALSLLVAAAASSHASLLSPEAVLHGSNPTWLAGPLGWLWPASLPREPILAWAFTGTLLAMLVSWALAFRHATSLPRTWVIVAIVLIQLVFALAPPLEYTDVFNYINYARMGVLHGLDPFTVLPVNGPHTDPSFHLSNWHYLRSPYGPLFTLISYVLVPLGIAGALWTYKLLVLGCSLALVAAVWTVAERRSVDPRRAAIFVGLNPIVIVWGLGGIHLDFIMVLLAFTAIWLVVDPPGGVHRLPWLRANADLVAAVLLVAAVGIKPSALVFIPVALAVSRRPGRMAAALGVSAALLALVSVAAFGATTGGLGDQSSLVAPESLPNLLGLLLGSGGETSTVRVAVELGAALVVVFAAARAARAPDTRAWGCCALAALAVVLALGWSAPWYVLWILPFAAVSRGRGWRTLIVVYCLVAILSWSPNIGEIEHASHLDPRSTPLGIRHVQEADHLASQ